MQVQKIIEPRPGTLIIKILPVTEDDRKTAGGIIMPESAESQNSIYAKAEVVRTASKKLLEDEMDFEEGDQIVISKAVVDRSGRFFIVGQEKYYQLLIESEFYGKL